MWIIYFDGTKFCSNANNLEITSAHAPTVLNNWLKSLYSHVCISVSSTYSSPTSKNIHTQTSAVFSSSGLQADELLPSWLVRRPSVCLSVCLSVCPSTLDASPPSFLDRFWFCLFCQIALPGSYIACKQNFLIAINNGDMRQLRFTENRSSNRFSSVACWWISILFGLCESPRQCAYNFYR